MAIARVEPLTRARALRGPFDYRLPDRLREVGVGSVLRVPFGPRRMLGVVVEVAERSELPSERLAEPIEALGGGASPELVRLGLRLAREYCSTPARALELVLPPGTGSERAGTAERRELRAAATPVGIAVLSDGTRLGARQRAILELLAGEGRDLNAGEIANRAGGDRSALRRLERRGLVRLSEHRVMRRPAIERVGRRAEPVRLTEAQRAALDRIEAALARSAGEELLLHGVTGSGKTEVYLAATARALERGRGVIVLVPEIALTPQTVSRFVDRFGEGVALLHSGLSAGARRDEWDRVRRGEARIAIGPRSTVFAPVPALGLVVVDEEHDTSYKQESDPRYDAREVARMRASATGALVVMGSATPRPESWRATERIELRQRPDGSALPPVQTLDMRGRPGGAGPLHPEALEALGRLRSEGGKAIVLVNRRGWSPFVDCRECGHVFQCGECDVSLVGHSGRDPAPGGATELRCHHCGHREPLPGACPECGSVSIARHGAGTERLESVLGEAVDPLPVFRLDSDTASARGSHPAILGAFERADAGVLVGTQMVAKGHDFGEVTLALVLDADATLRFPDFRAEERTFALISQLAGRSGRGPRGGRVLVQTRAPGAAAIVHASRHDAAGFLDAELERRRALRYPPFSSLVRIEVAAADVRRARLVASELATSIRPGLPSGSELLGPAPRLRLRGRHRRQLLVKAGDRKQVVPAVGAAVQAAAARRLRGVQLSVDVDPQ